MVSKYAHTMLFAMLACCTLGVVARADGPTSAPPAAHCEDGRDELADIVCNIGRASSTVTLPCEARALMTCTATSPGFVTYSCFGPNASAHDQIALSGSAADFNSLLSQQPTANIQGVERQIRDMPPRDFARWWRTTRARFEALQCTRGRERTSDSARTQYLLCGSVEVELYAYLDRTSWDVRVRASTTAYADCLSLGIHGHIEPRFGEVPENIFEVAVPVLERRCRSRDAEACAELGSRHMSTRGGPRMDPERGFRLSVQACELGSVRGCSNVGFAYDEARGVARDTARARTLYEDVCTRGWGSACARLGQMSERAIGTPHDEAAATQYYARGCAANEMYACRLWGARLRDGVGVTADRAAARRVFEQACTARDGESCLELCTVAADEARCAPTVRAIENACTAGATDQCARLCLIRGESPCNQGRGVSGQ